MNVLESPSMFRIERWKRVACVALLGCSSARLAQAETSATNKAAAEALFTQGRSFLEQGKLEQACAKFAASQALDSGFGTLMNLADCYSRRGMTASAWATYKEAAALARGDGQTERQASALAQATQLEATLPKLLIHAAPESAKLPGLELRINAQSIPPAVWGTELPVDPGPLRLELSAPEHTPLIREIAVPREAQVVTVDLPALQRIPSTNSPGVARPPTQSKASSSADSARSVGDAGQLQRTVSYVSLGAGVVGLAVGSVFGLRAISLNKDSDKECRTEKFCTEEGVALRDRARTAATVSTVTFVVGGAFAAAGITLWALAPSRETPRTSLSLSPTPGGLFVSATGGF